MTTVPARSHFVIRDTVRLHHLDWGSQGRHPVVLLHGIRLHAHVWNHFSRRFKNRFHIVALDQRGHGDSGWGAEDRYHVEEFYQDLRAVVQARGLSRFTLVGHSLGGMVSMLYASRHHEEVERLVLVDVTAERPAVPPGANHSLNSDAQQPRDFDSPETAVAYLGRLMSRAPVHMVEESVRHGIRQTDNGRYTWKYDPALFRRRRPTSPAMDYWSMVSTISTPTLLQYGSRSPVVTPELAARMARTMPRCTVERIEGAGHAPFTDQPEAFASSVERFIVGE
jgi:esterase